MPSAKYPISQTILDIMSEYSCTEEQFVTTFLGYRADNIDKGIRRLRSWIETGHGPQSIIKGLSWATGRGPELREAIAATERVKEQEADSAFRRHCEAEADTFRPYIHVVGETRIPNGITLFAVTGGKWNLIDIPVWILELPLEQQLSALPPLMQVYLRKFNGVCPFFGRVMKFLFVRLLDHFEYDNHGVLIGQVDKPFRRGYAVCSLK